MFAISTLVCAVALQRCSRSSGMVYSDCSVLKRLQFQYVNIIACVLSSAYFYVVFGLYKYIGYQCVFEGGGKGSGWVGLSLDQ